MRRVLKPGGVLCLADFGRLKSLHSVIFFAYLNARHQPHLFSLDHERSLRAVLLKDDFVSTFKVPFLLIIKTADRPLPVDLRQRIDALRASLNPRYRRDLNDLANVFCAGRAEK